MRAGEEVSCVSPGITDPRNPEIQQQNTPGVLGSRPKVTCVPAGCEPKRALGIPAHNLTVTNVPAGEAGRGTPSQRLGNELDLHLSN